MKENNKQSQIILSKDELDLTIDALELWVKISREQFNHFDIIMEDVLHILKHYSNNKEKYYFNFNCTELNRIHDALADKALYYDGDFYKLKSICKKVEKILNKNYKNPWIVYLTNDWDSIIQNQITQKLIGREGNPYGI